MMPAEDLVELARSCDEWLGSTDENALSELIYYRYYCRPSAAVGPASAAAHTDLVAAYERVNHERTVMERGWRFVAREPAGLVVTKGGVHFWVAEEDVQLVDEGEALVRVPVERTNRIPGFYSFSGETSPPRPSTKTTRLYWHLNRGGAVRFVEQLSDVLNRARVPFLAKLLREPSHFCRADAAVLYLDRESLHESLPSVRTIHNELRSFLRESVPRFTMRWASGLGVADDPGPGFTSFGQHRCLVAARALLGSASRSAEERLESLIHAYDEAGLCPTRTHLATADAPAYPDFA